MLYIVTYLGDEMGQCGDENSINSLILITKHARLFTQLV